MNDDNSSATVRRSQNSHHISRTMHIRTCQISTPCSHTRLRRSACHRSPKCTLTGRSNLRFRPRPSDSQHHRACALPPPCNLGHFQVAGRGIALALPRPGSTAELSCRQCCRSHRSACRKCFQASRSSNRSPYREGRSTGTSLCLRGGDLQSQPICHRFHASVRPR
jgi:hypothetical protein